MGSRRMVRIVNGEIVQDAQPATSSPRTTRTGSLQLSHRSIRLAHSFSLVAILFIGVVWIPLFQILMGVSWRFTLLFLGIAIFHARRGGQWLHGVIPGMLQEGPSPTTDEVVAAPGGGFSLEALSDPAGKMREEW